MYTTREEVENWLKKMKLENYVINEDLTVDVNGNVNLSSKNLKEIPIQFGVVNGYFDCSNNNLTNLENCPKEVSGSYFCSDNKLTSLKGVPQYIYGNFYCCDNQLTNLEYCPKEINNNFDCGDNKLTDLKYCPQKISGKFFHIINNRFKEEELINFNCDITNVNKIYSDFNENGSKEEFINKVNYYKSIQKENELLKELIINNNIKLNNKL